MTCDGDQPADGVSSPRPSSTVIRPSAPTSSGARRHSPIGPTMYDLGARWLTAQGEAHPGSRVSKRWVRMRINEQYRPDGWLGFKRNVREDLL